MKDDCYSRIGFLFLSGWNFESFGQIHIRLITKVFYFYVDYQPGL